MTNANSYWLAIIPLAAAGLAWLLNQFSAFLTLHLADRRTLRETLYFLLELRHLLRVAQRLRDTPKISQFFLTSLAQRLPGMALTADQHKQLKDTVKELLPKIEGQLVNDSNLRDSYGAMLVKLASVSPLYAYQLRGKDSLLSFVNSLAEQTADPLRQQARSLVEAARQRHLPAPVSPAQPRTVHITAGLEEIERIMLAIARSISWREQRQLKKLLEKDEYSADLVAQRIIESGVTFLAETVEQLAEN